MKFSFLSIFSLLIFNISCSQPSPSPGERIEQATDSLMVDSLNFDYLIIRANAYAELESHEKALPDLNRAISIMHENEFLASHAYISRGDIYFHLGNHRKALEDFNEGIRLKPEDSYGYLRRGIFKCEYGDSTGCEDLKIAMKLGHFDDIALKKYCK